MKNKKLILISISIIFCILTLIKLFIGLVFPRGDASVYLVIKKHPTIKNTWVFEEETPKDQEKYTAGKWYYDGEYYIISSGENSVTGQKALLVLVGLWWIMIFAFVITGIIKLKR